MTITRLNSIQSFDSPSESVPFPRTQDGKTAISASLRYGSSSQKYCWLDGKPKCQHHLVHCNRHCQWQGIETLRGCWHNTWSHSIDQVRCWDHMQSNDLSPGQLHKLCAVQPEDVGVFFYCAPQTASEICYVIFGVLIIVMSNRHNEVSLCIFLGDKVYIFSSRRTN